MISYPTGTRLTMPDGALLDEDFSQRVFECFERLETLGQLDSVHPDNLEELVRVEDAALLATLKFLVSLHAVSCARSKIGRRAKQGEFEIQRASRN
jgi:hypothetical protein